MENNQSQTNFTITKPDDWHVHVRNGSQMQDVIAFTAQQFKRAVIMPNLASPITTVDKALTYKQDILLALCKAKGLEFEPLMTLYLTDETSKDEIRKAKQHDIVGIKLYPAGATTNSDKGVKSLEKLYSHFEVMQEVDIPLLVHGEVTDPDVDIFDREAVFIDKHLLDIVKRFPNLRVVLEHITTKEGVQFVEAYDNEKVAATITAHHLLKNRNAIFHDNASKKVALNPHNFCLPVLKREEHRQALLNAVFSDSLQFFLGSDSAPHAQFSKESACGCAGCFTAHAAIELYATAFEMHALENGISFKRWVNCLEQFSSTNGTIFYRRSYNNGGGKTITLQRQAWIIPGSYSFGTHDSENHQNVIPFLAGQTLQWKVVS